MEINGEITKTMKGLAILFIVLHNFLHLAQFGFVQENEMKFDISRSFLFYDHLSNPSWTLLYDFFSFIGWCGVPVFVFLSGYGLSKKYEDPRKDINLKWYIKHSYKKLLLLILPAAVFFIIYQCFRGNYQRAFYYAFSSLTFSNNILNYRLSIPSAAPPYWYFGMTFQLYLLYLFMYRVVHNKYLLFIALAFVTFQFILNPLILPDQILLGYIKKNSFGWIPLFVVGIIFARARLNIPLLKNGFMIGIFTILLLFLLILFNLNYLAWVLIPFLSVVFFYYLSTLVNRNNVTKRIGLWFGSYSSYMFVVHPIALLIVVPLYKDNFCYILSGVLLFYVVLTISLSFIYKQIHFSLIKIF